MTMTHRTWAARISVCVAAAQTLWVVLGAAAPPPSVAAKTPKPLAAKNICIDTKVDEYGCINKYVPDADYHPDTSKNFWGWPRFGTNAKADASNPHNCTLFATYMAYKNGLTTDPWPSNEAPGNAGDWQSSSSVSKYVDRVPAIGAIAELTDAAARQAAYGSAHVAYVYRIDGTKVYTVSDNFDSKLTSAEWWDLSIVTDMRFIHFADPAQPPLSPTSLRAVLTNGRAEVTWNWNESGASAMNGRRVEKFQVTTNSNGGYCEGNSATRSCKLTGLRLNGSAIQITLNATSLSGRSLDRPVTAWLRVQVPTCRNKTKNLATCYTILRNLGLLTHFVDASGKRRSPWVYQNWKVTKQAPSGGSWVDVGETVTLHVLKSYERG